MEPDSRVGTVVQDRYRILERLASGGMGVVYRAERLQLGRTVAMKFLHSSFAKSPEFIRRFESEAKLMSRLEHPNCVSVIDFGVQDAAFIVMDFVTGRALSDVVDEVGRLDPTRAIGLGRQILAGLAHAHERGIVHRDVKPANIMLATVAGTGDHVRLLDFGLAKLVDADQSLSGIAVGTPSFMAPEQGVGGPADGRADIYSTGVVLFELLTGERPFRADHAFDLIRMHASEPVPRLADACPQQRYSDELEQVIARSMEKSPDDRFQTPGELADALATVPEKTGELSAPRAPKAVQTRSSPVSAPRRSVVRLALSIAAAIIIVVALASSTVRGKLGQWGHSIGQLVGWGGDDRSAADSPASPSELPATVESVEELVAAGETESAIQMLHQIRRDSPDDARASYRLGQLYHAKGWSLEALAAWAEALEIDPSYRTREELVGPIIDALSDERTRNKAGAIIATRLGKSAIAALRRAEREHDAAVVRAESRRLREILER